MSTNLGKNLKRLRLRAGLTQIQLCVLAETTAVAVIETRGSAQLGTIERLAAALRVPVAALLGPIRRKRSA